MPKIQVVISKKEEVQIREFAKKEKRSLSNLCNKILIEKLKELEDGTRR